MTLARVIARIARGEIEFLFGQFKMASKVYSFDLAYLLNGYFTVINSSTVKTKNLKDAQGKLQKKPTHQTRAPNIENKVYIKPTNIGLLLYYQSHVDIRYKRGLLKTMLDRAYRLSSCWTYFSEECDRLKALFSWLKYPEQLINTTVRCFVSSKTEDRQPISATDESPTVRIVLPFKDQDSADFVRKQLNDLSHKTRTVIQPVFVSNKIEQKLKVQEKKPPIVNQQCVVYRFQCDLCDASYVGYTLRHLHQRVDEHKNTTSSIGKHFRDKHRIVPKDLDKQFHVIEKCKTKFDCLVHEMLVIRELSPSLNVQSDSIRAKLFA